jgi:hypothetical protein
MSYFVRILTVADLHPPASALGDDLEGLAQLRVTAGDDATWTKLVVASRGGVDVAEVVCDPADSEMGREELREFFEEIAAAEPVSGRRWVEAYLRRVKSIYAVQVLEGAAEDDNASVLEDFLSVLAGHAGGILQADFEGFTNEEGAQVLWQFPDDAEGPWVCAVLDEQGEWQPFEMDLEDAGQRAEFRAGKVPEHARRIVPDAD